MNLDFETSSGESRPALWRHVTVWTALLIAAFLLGFVPSWLSERQIVRQRDAAQSNLRLSLMQNRLATAAITADRGEFEPARSAASDFFTDLRAELEREEYALNVDQRETMKRILDERDEIITLLARNDRAAIERLTTSYLNYARAVNPSALKTVATK